MAVSVSSVLSLQGGSGASKEDPVCNLTLSYKAGPASKPPPQLYSTACYFLVLAAIGTLH